MHQSYSVSERLSYNSRIKRFVSYTQVPVHYNNIQALASCTTSVYVNLSKNSFFMLPPKILRESGCKGTNNINTIQTFSLKKIPKT